MESWRPSDATNVVAQTIIVATLLSVQDQFTAGLIHTTCASLYLVSNDGTSFDAKALDVLTEAVIAASDAAPPGLAQWLRLASIGLCGLCSYRFAQAASRAVWWPAAEAVNSAADGLWAAVAFVDPAYPDDAYIARACQALLVAMALLLLYDATSDLLSSQ